ncbi:hypothetical protein [Frateuria sp. STR12]|uniref:hypothetical protein n=1 Tax=Frateuria hangzhouensis TaxID=2995589 RepID=UPI002260B4F1|nr:hypothetical protein [Frateuria sp. STR12]MCX7512584.1 hypothetical protein [Frateuria sp. STR12]
MTIQARSFALPGMALAGLLLLGGCGKHDDETATTPPAASSAPMPAPASTAPAPASTVAPAATGTSAVPASAGTSAVAAPAAPAVFQVAQVELGGSVTAGYEVAKPTTTFAPSQNTIYASVATTGSTTGATLSAHFSYLEGKGQDVTTISQTIATDGPAVTAFKLRNPNDWPAGTYKVEIAIDGKPVKSETFEVKSA